MHIILLSKDIDRRKAQGPKCPAKDHRLLKEKKRKDVTGFISLAVFGETGQTFCSHLLYIEDRD